MKLTNSQITNILIFTGLLFTTARMIRGTDNLYALALLSFIGIWILNYKSFWDLKFKRSVIWFLPFGVWAALSAIWSLEPFVSLTRGLFYTFIMLTAVLIGFIYKNKHKELFKIFLALNALFIILSFISLISGIPEDAWTANHGMGFTSIFGHQNTLAAVLMFTLIGPVYLFVKSVIPNLPVRQAGLFRDLKADADIHQHDNNQTRHSELEEFTPQLLVPQLYLRDLAGESKGNKNMDSHFRENDNTEGTVIPNLPVRQAGSFRDLKNKLLNPVQHDKKARGHSDEGQNLKGTRTDAEKKHFSMTSQNEGGQAKIKRFVIPARLKPESIFYFLLLISNLYFIYLSYSRAVMLALFIGGLFFIYLLGTLKFNLIFTTVMLILGTSIYYVFQTDLTNYLKKGADNYFDRREILWQPSYQAALNGGIIGLGYGVTDPTIESNYKKENKFGELKREKGNSILALIEEVGIIGLVLFFIPIVYPAVNFKETTGQTKNFLIFNLEFLILFSFLLVFLVHSQFEAWWTGISSLFLIIFILVQSILFTVNEQIKVDQFD